MFTSIFIGLIISLTATIFIARSPLFLGLWIILLALTISLALAASSASWLGLIIFIIYVGGLLVIFAYFVALTPNLLIEGATITTLRAATLFTALCVFYLAPISSLKNGSAVSNSPLTHFFLVNAPTIVALAIILFLALVAVVKLCSSFSAPLRPFNYYVNLPPQIPPPY